MPAASSNDEEHTLIDDHDTATHDTPGLAHRFNQWRKNRPFIPGLLMMISGFVIAAPAYITVEVSDILVMISTVSGVSTLLIGVLMFMFGLGCWLQPATAVYLGVLAIIVSVISLPTSNLGGFVVGALFGIVGGALALGWEPGEKSAKKRKGKHAKRASVADAPEQSEDFDPFAEDAFDEADPETSETEQRGGSSKWSGGSTLNSVVAVAAASAVLALLLSDTGVVSAQEPAAPAAPQLPQVELPKLPAPELQLPEIPKLPAPSVPNVPGLPAPTQPAPESSAPAAPAAPGAGEGASIGTSAIPSGLAPAAAPSTVTADKVTLTGNVHATLDYVNVGGQQQRALVLSGDRLVGHNLGLKIPGMGGGNLTTGNVDTTVTNGPVKVVATGLTATPAVRDLPTIPVTVDLSGDINSVLDQLGVPDKRPVPNVEVPDMLMNEISLNNVTMQMVTLYGQGFNAPSVRLTVP